MADQNAIQYRYLQDTKNDRQYALRFVNDVVQPPLAVFAPKIQDAKINTGEVFFAIDDDVKRSVISGDSLLEATVYRFAVVSDHEPRFNAKRHDVKYRMEFTGVDEAKSKLYVKYKLTDESYQDLKQKYAEKGVPLTDFPAEFSDEIDIDDRDVVTGPAGQIISVSLEILDNVSLPPHQKKLAYIARMAVHKMLAPNLQKDPAKTGVAPAFNRKSAETGKNLKVSAATIEGLLRQFSVDLTEKAKEGRLDPVVGRDSEIEDSIKILSRRKKASLCFTAEAGAGKTAMFHGVAQFIAKGEGVPEALKNARVIELDFQAMVAGTKYRGQFEERLKPIIDGLMEREGYLNGRKIILAIDEIHEQLKAGSAEGTGGAGQMLKPFLTAPGISVMGATTAKEYREHIEKDGALARRFKQKVLVQPDAALTKTILNKAWPLTRDHHGLTGDLTDQQIDYIVNMSNRYAPNEAQPDKSVDVLESAAASAGFRGSKKIEPQDIIAAVAQMSKLSVSFLSQNDADRFLKLEQELPKEVLGQPGIGKITDSIIGARSGLNDPNQPWAAFVLQGPTGTGKTETCKALARYLFGDEKAMIQLNMGEYSEKHTVSRLIGAPPGYVGFDSAEPALTEKIRQRPYAILLLDEIEKAHPDVFNVLLPVLNDGKMTDNHGKTILFNNVIVVMTTNLGAREAMEVLQGNSGFDFSTGKKNNPAEVQERLAKKYEQARGQFFRPEMVNRLEELGGFVTFIPLAEEIITKLVDREVGKVNQRISDKSGAGVDGVTIEISASAKAQLAKDGYKPDMGARPLRKVVREKIANPIGKWVMAHKAELQAFVEKNGGAKLYVAALGELPKVLRPDEQPPAAIANDDKPAAVKPRSPVSKI